MMIQTIGKKYMVTQYSYADSHFMRYKCREEGKKEMYSMTCIKDKTWIRRVTKFLMDQMENPNFTDYVSCFFSEECLYVLMKYRAGISLRETLLKAHCGLEGRMAIGKNILEKILLLKMPDYFLQDCLWADRIILSTALEVEFQYELANLPEYESYDFCHVQARLAGIFEELFMPEIQKRVLPDASRFCDALYGGEYADMLEVYQAYQELCRNINEIPPEELKIPRTPSFQIWEKIRRQFGTLKKVCALFLLIAALAFLVYTVSQSGQSGGEKRIFTSIGTLKIQ